MTAWTVSSAVAGNRRDELAQFWLASPDDILENLWNSPVGDATRQLVAQLSPSTYFTPAQVELRNQLGRDLQAGLQQPGAVKRLIANFLFSPPGQMRIANPQANLPAWLVPGYAALYEQGQTSSFPPQPVAPPIPAAPAQASNPKPDFGHFPTSLHPAEDQLRATVTTRLQPSAGGGFGQPGAINAFLVAMAFYEPGSMQVEGAEQKLPAWLLSGYREVFAQALSA